MNSFLGKKSKGPNIVIGGPSIADLMPPRAKKQFKERKLKKQWSITVLAVTFAMLTLSSLTYAFNMYATSSFESEHLKQKAVTAEIESFSEVSQILDNTSMLRSMRSEALIAEVSWRELINRIVSQLPEGIELTSFFVQAGGTPTGTPTPVVAFTANFSSSQPITYSDVLGNFNSIKGVSNVEVGDLTRSGDNDFTYTVAFGVDETAFSNRFAVTDTTSEIDKEGDEQ